MSDYLQRLSESIFSLHGCKATHVSTTPVKEVFRGQTVWEGAVETFDLKGHPKAKQIYAWGYENPNDPKKLEVTAVLKLPPVTSEVEAVRVAVASSAKRKE
jgi:hypothetical protein